MSNERKVLENIPEDELAKGGKDLNISNEKLPTERVLGMMWSIEEDEFGFRIQMKDGPPTRRGSLSIVSSVYDPIGSSLSSSASSALEEKWQSWQKEMPRLAEFKMNRCMRPEGF